MSAITQQQPKQPLPPPTTTATTSTQQPTATARQIQVIAAPSLPVKPLPRLETTTPASAPSSIFLAGITTTPWRERVIAHLSSTASSPSPTTTSNPGLITIYNPLRPDWASAIPIEDPELCPAFREQVEWEMRWAEESDVVVFWFEGVEKGEGSVGLLELGVALGGRRKEKKKSVVVGCDRAFWKRGNVLMVCERFGVPVVETLQEVCVAVGDVLGCGVDEKERDTVVHGMAGVENAGLRF